MEKQSNKDKKPQELLLDQVLGAKLQQIEPEGGSVPETLKEEVFSTLDTINFLADVTDLFTAKFTKAETAVFEAANDAFEEEE